MTDVYVVFRENDSMTFQYSLSRLGGFVDFSDDPKLMLEVDSRPTFLVRPLEQEHLTLTPTDPASREQDGYTVWGVVATWTEGEMQATGKGYVKVKGSGG